MIRRRRTLTRMGGLFAVLATGAGCTDDETSAGTTRPPAPAVTAEKCIVRLHGKGATGGDSIVVDGVAEVRPTGNADGWGQRQWLYYPDDRYEEARAIVASALDEVGCTTAVIGGFSNGASFAAKLYCRGETFGGRVVGYVIDDPVTDAGVVPCRPAEGVKATLYWTGALDSAAPAGQNCTAIDWTCEGDISLGIEAYAAALGVAVQPSPYTDHQPYEAPELRDWLN